MPSAGGEEDGAEPETLRDPGRDVQDVGRGEEGPHREQVADVLVGDRPRATVGFHMKATWLRNLVGSR